MPKKLAWYKPRNTGFVVKSAVSEFLILVVLTFVAGGLNALIAAIEGGSLLIPQEYVAYTGLILAILHTLYTIVVNYKK
jgi:hypothetical protein